MDRLCSTGTHEKTAGWVPELFDHGSHGVGFVSTYFVAADEGGQ